MQRPPRALFAGTLTLGVGASLLYLWLRFFAPHLEASLVGALGYLLGTVGLFGLLPYWVPRHARTPDHLLRWNAFIALIGLAHSLLWHILAAATENARLANLFLGIATMGLLWQIALHSVFAAYLVLIRPTKIKLYLLYAYYSFVALSAVFLAFRLESVSGLLTLFLWALALPLIYYSQDAVGLGTRNGTYYLLLVALCAALFLGVEVFPGLFGRDDTILGIYTHLLAISSVIFYAGLLIVPLVTRIGPKAQKSQQLLSLLTAFLEQQQKQESVEGIIETAWNTLQELETVQGVYMRLRSAGPQNGSYPRLVEFLFQGLRVKVPHETYIETISNTAEVSRGLPAVAAIVIQRPIMTILSSVPVDALQAVIIGTAEDCFEASDVQLIATLVEQTALFMEALDRRLYQEERRLSRKEIDFLKETREALLPPVPPIFGKVAYHVVFQQHDKTIGGDYYQIEEVVPEKVIDFWLSDCAGSGIAAAYQMAQARAALNTLWPEKLPPEDMLLRLNDALRRVFHKNNFIAATYLRLDLETQTYTLYRPGNPEILYWDPRIQKVEILRPAGVVLGNASSTLVRRILEKHSAPLIPGATWLFFSDGFTEATNLAGEQFGLERLLHLFQTHLAETPEAIARHILQAVQDFVGDTHLGDDGTLIVIRYQP